MRVIDARNGTTGAALIVTQGDDVPPATHSRFGDMSMRQ
jgi:hypothetical protein